MLPCGAGKTIVGLAAMAALKAETLILTTSTTAVEQWKREILDKTDIDPAARSAPTPATPRRWRRSPWRPTRS